MVAISLYRGNLHRVEDVPRRWVMPRPGISMKEFRGLLRRRSKALSLLKSTSSNGSPPPPPPPPPPQKRPDQQTEKEDVAMEALESDTVEDMRDVKAEDVAMEALVHLASLDKGEENEKKNEDPNSEGSHRPGASDEKEKRRKEVEEKLEILTKKKHSLVLALKQILSAEEELKRKSSIAASRPSSISLQVDVSNDSGSMTRIATPRRTASEANLLIGNGNGNTAAAATDDVVNHDLLSRHIPRVSNNSISPSAESALKRPYSFHHNAVSNPNPNRSSPLRFPFPGNPSNMPAVSVTVPGTNYMVSSSSPAASVGTSSFKDTPPTSS